MKVIRKIATVLGVLCAVLCVFEANATTPWWYQFAWTGGWLLGAVACYLIYRGTYYYGR
jgi:hypothetical protein